MKEYLLYIFCIAALLINTGCQNAGTPYEMKIASAAPTEEPGTQALLKYAELVNERSQGRINAKVYAAGVLGGNRDVSEGVQLGTIEVQMASSSPLAAFVPSLNIFELPFLFENNEHMFAVLDSEIGKSFIPDLEEQGFHLLGYFTFGVRHIMTTGKPIHSVEDMAGLKIRTMESISHLDAFKAFGASPLPMAYNELFLALQTGMIDGAEAANSNYYSKRFFEVAPNWAQIGWLRLVAPVIMNKKFFDLLPPDLQKIVDDSLKELEGYERDLYSAVGEQRLEELKAAGVTITYPDREGFFEAARPVYDKWADSVGGWDKINKILNFDYSSPN
jgi:tripartite ATP-independent transporter DctP family solute receptor